MRMRRNATLVFLLGFFAGPLLATGPRAQPPAQAPAQVTARGKIAEINVSGSQKYAREQIAEASGLKIGDMAGREEIQAAADRLAQLGVFSNVRYRFSSKGQDLEIEFQLEDAHTYPLYFDNFPWFSDKEITEAIKKDVPFFDGTAPEQGTVADDILRAMAALLKANDIHGEVEASLMVEPGTDVMVQYYHWNGPTLKTGTIEFTGPGTEFIKQDPGVTQLLRDLIGKPYSRFGVAIFAFEKVRPLFVNRGELRVKIEKPVARFVGDPGKPLPDNVRVTVAVEPGPVYHWGGVTWVGNGAFAAAELDRHLGLTEGMVAAGDRTQEAWENVRAEYLRRGYVDIKLSAEPVFDDAAERVSYRVTVAEGPVYRMGELVLTGLSLTAERRLIEAWKIPKGEIFDGLYFQNFLADARSKKIFGEMVVTYNEVGHWLRTNAEHRVVDVLLDFK